MLNGSSTVFVLGGPEVVRVVLNSSSSTVGHAPVHSDSDPRAWGSGDHARCVEQQQQHSTVFILCNRAAVQNLVLMAMDDL